MGTVSNWDSFLQVVMRGEKPRREESNSLAGFFC